MDKLLAEHPWMFVIGNLHIQKQETEAQTAVQRSSERQQNLFSSGLDGNEATTIKHDGMADTTNDQESAAVAVEPKVDKAVMQARREKAEARAAEKVVAAAETALETAQLYADTTTDAGRNRICSLKGALAEAISDAEIERVEAEIAVAEVAAVVARVDADTAAALAMVENAEAEAAELTLARAEADLTEAELVRGSSAVKEAEKKVVAARLEAEREKGEAKVAIAMAAIQKAEAFAETAAVQALQEGFEAEAAAQNMAAAEAALLTAQSNGVSNDIVEAEQRLAEALAAVEKEALEAEVAKAEAGKAEALVQAEIEAAKTVIDRVEAQAANNAEVTKQNTTLTMRLSLGASAFLVAAVVCLSFGASSMMYTFAQRVMDNDKMLVECQSHNFVALIGRSLIKDLLDSVSRSANLVSTNSASTTFSGSTLQGSYPASIMGIMASGMPFVGNASSMFTIWQVLNSLL